MKKRIIQITALAALFVAGCAALQEMASNAGITLPEGVVAKTVSVLGGSSDDYVGGLEPSAASREYFRNLKPDDNPVLVKKSGGVNNTGVRWTADNGIVIPAGTTIAFENKGYCMDPSYPAPKKGEEFQLVSAESLFPAEVYPIYKNLMIKYAQGDKAVARNMQSLVWALRTVDSGNSFFAQNMSAEQRRIIASCSATPGQFDGIVRKYAAQRRARQEVLKVVDGVVNFEICGITYSVSDFASPERLQDKVNDHIRRLTNMSADLPVAQTGLRYGEIRPGVYTDVVGSGYLSCTIKIANTTTEPYVYYPTLFAAQVGCKITGGFMSASNENDWRQRVTLYECGTIIIIVCNPGGGGGGGDDDDDDDGGGGVEEPPPPPPPPPTTTTTTRPWIPPPPPPTTTRPTPTTTTTTTIPPVGYEYVPMTQANYEKMVPAASRAFNDFRYDPRTGLLTGEGDFVCRLYQHVTQREFRVYCPPALPVPDGTNEEAAAVAENFNAAVAEILELADAFGRSENAKMTIHRIGTGAIRRIANRL